jgi:hypothetical protein
MNPLTPNTPNFTHSFIEFKVFGLLEVLGAGFKMFFELQNQRNNVRGFDLFDFLSVFAHNLSTL